MYNFDDWYDRGVLLAQQLKKSIFDFNEADHPRDESGRFTSKGEGEKSGTEYKKKIKYSGEFVLTSSGSKDFGEISPNIAKQIKRQAGKIRLRIGKEVAGEKGNYGEAHLNKKARLKDINAAGFSNARDYIEYACKDFDAIYENKSGLIIYKQGNKKHNSVYVQLTASEEGDFYDVKTAVPSSRNTVKNKKPLWVKTQNGF